MSAENQRVAWNEWNAAYREKRLSEVSIDQRTAVLTWLETLNRTDLDIIEVGCGAGWLCPAIAPFGRVTATDLSDEVLDRARIRFPDVSFVAGDFMTLNFPDEGFDVVITLEVLAHVADQPAFVAKLARLLRPDGLLMLATQNRAVVERMNRTPPPIRGQVRQWVDRDELTTLLAPQFDILEMRTITPRTNRLPWRLVNNGPLNAVLKLVFGSGPERWKEAAGWGWTLMALARRRSMR